MLQLFVARFKASSATGPAAESALAMGRLRLKQMASSAAEAPLKTGSANDWTRAQSFGGANKLPVLFHLGAERVRRRLRCDKREPDARKLSARHFRSSGAQRDK